MKLAEEVTRKEQARMRKIPSETERDMGEIFKVARN